MPKINDVAVLDIGSKKISVMIGSKSEKGVYNIKGFGSCYYSGFSGGRWFNPDDVRNTVGKALRIAEAESGVKVKKLYVGVPSEFIALVVKEVVFARARAQRITDADLTALFEQGDTYKNHSRYTTIGNFAVYYTLDDKTRRYLEPRGLEAYKITALVSYVLCERSFTTFFEEIAKDLHLKEVEYVSSAWAEGMSLLSEDKRYRRQLLVDVGYITSSVAVVQGDGLVNLTSFSLGGGHIASDISMMFDVPFSAAEEVKNKIDLSLAYDESSYYEAGENGKYRFSALDVNEIAKSRLDTIVEFINESIAQSGFECNAHCPVYLTGNGVTSVRGAKEYMSQVLKKPIDVIAPDVPCYNKPKFSSTIALLDVASELNAQELTGFNKILQNLLSKIGG